jgi:hypothetical protein
LSKTCKKPEKDLAVLAQCSVKPTFLIEDKSIDSSISRKTCEKFARMGGMILVNSLLTTLADRRLGLKQLSGHCLIQFSNLNKNIAV